MGPRLIRLGWRDIAIHGIVAVGFHLLIALPRGDCRDKLGGNSNSLRQSNLPDTSPGASLMLARSSTLGLPPVFLPTISSNSIAAPANQSRAIGLGLRQEISRGDEEMKRDTQYNN